MLTMRAAAMLLESSRSMAGLAEVIGATRLASSPSPLDAATIERLGLECDRAEMAAGPGHVRVIVLQFKDAPLRECLRRTSRRLSNRAPHVLWLVAAVDPVGETAAIAAWTTAARSQQIAAFVWEPSRVVDSDAETLCALAAVGADSDDLLHARCVEVLGRDALTRRFYRALENQVRRLAGTVPHRLAGADGREIALLYASRLLFLCFLEAKGWLDGDRAFISHRFDACMLGGGDFHQRVLLPLFFGTLNTPFPRRAAAAREFGKVPFLNGGLFVRTALERALPREWRFPDDVIGELLDRVFRRFRFVAREDSATWSEASIDPEMLGRAFESLMSSSDRQSNGSYYTPHALVARATESALDECPVLQRGSWRDLRHIRVLDPACGSGAFLVYALERLAELRRERGEASSTSALRRDVLAQSIFGVDRDPTAVWLCELRLWLSVVIEDAEIDPRRIPPLPNLDRNVRVGDALGGPGFSEDPRLTAGSARIRSLRRRYVVATGAPKMALARMLDREERRRALADLDRRIDVAVYERRERISAQRARDLFGNRSSPSASDKHEQRRLRDALRALRGERRRVSAGGALPFSFPVAFAETQAAGGFDVIIGNPPWVRLHRIPAALRLRFKDAFKVFRFAPWKSGAAVARAGTGFASQVDLAALFVERSVCLLRERGVMSLLTPVKLCRSLAGGGMRDFLTSSTAVVRLEDLSESKHAFQAAVYPALLVARKTPVRSPLRVAVHTATGEREWETSLPEVAFDATPGSPWLIVDPESRRAFERLRSAGVPLACTPFGSPRLGVKSGCNAAFIVRVTGSGRDIASVVDADGETGSVELALLRPALRGDSVTMWSRGPCREWIVWTHDAAGAPLDRLPDRARTWLRRRYGDLAARSDAARSRRWWSLFRVEAASTDLPRVVWADFGRRPRALVLDAGDPAVPLNTCYVVRCAGKRDALALASLINSPLVASWLNVLAEPARGGYRRYLGWTVAQLPIPRDWSLARDILADVSGASDSELLRATLESYGLRNAEMEPLLGCEC